MNLLTYKTEMPRLRKNHLFDAKFVGEFNACTTDLGRFKVVSKSIAREKCPLTLMKSPESEKNLNYALELKQKGNNFFKKNLQLDALKFYTRSYLQTPTEKTKELSIILANRSAALYHLDENELALKDIQRSLDLGYPTEMQYKLRERQARCHMANKCAFEAMDAFKLTIKILDESNLPEESRQKLKKECETMIKKIGNTINKNMVPKSSPTDGNKELEPERHLHEGVSFDYDEKQGRFAKAAKKIRVGSTVAVAKPHCSGIWAGLNSTHCHHCYRKTVAPLACPTCAEVSFCDENCRDAAINNYHKIECKIIITMYSETRPFRSTLAVRILTQKSAEYFTNFLEELGEKEEIPIEERLKADYSDYRKVYNLFIGECSTDEFLEFAILAEFFIALLEKTDYFKGSTDPDIKLKLGAVTLRNLQILQFNSHTIYETERYNGITEKEATAIGVGLYPSVCLFNHSCDPSVTHHFRGTTMHVNAFRTIEKGETVTENYGPNYTVDGRTKRRKELRDKYRFDCECEACLKNWPTYAAMPKDYLNFRCKSTKGCKGFIYLSLTSHIAPKCSECGRPISLAMVHKSNEYIIKMWGTASRLLSNGEVDAALRMYCTILEKWEETCVPPFKDYFHCQLKIRVCLLEYGNH